MDDSLGLALEFAKAKHKGQKRIGGDDYITHPIAVCEIVKNQGFDENYQIAALFHDLLEDTDATAEEILTYGSSEVLEAVKSSSSSLLYKPIESSGQFILAKNEAAR